jgi:hypothetical protein
MEINAKIVKWKNINNLLSLVLYLLSAKAEDVYLKLKLKERTTVPDVQIRTHLWISSQLIKEQPHTKEQEEGALDAIQFYSPTKPSATGVGD